MPENVQNYAQNYYNKLVEVAASRQKAAEATKTLPPESDELKNINAAHRQLSNLAQQAQNKLLSEMCDKNIREHLEPHYHHENLKNVDTSNKMPESFKKAVANLAAEAKNGKLAPRYDNQLVFNNVFNKFNAEAQKTIEKPLKNSRPRKTINPVIPIAEKYWGNEPNKQVEEAYDNLPEDVKQATKFAYSKYAEYTNIINNEQELREKYPELTQKLIFMSKNHIRRFIKANENSTDDKILEQVKVCKQWQKGYKAVEILREVDRYSEKAYYNNEEGLYDKLKRKEAYEPPVGLKKFVVENIGELGKAVMIDKIYSSFYLVGEIADSRK